GVGRPMDLRGRAGDVVARACAAGARAADGLVGESEGLSVTVRLGETEKLKRARQRRAGLRVLVGNSTAIVSTADLSPPALDALVRDACALARATAPDPHAGLPDPVDLAREQPDLDLYDPAIEGLEPPAALALAREAARRAVRRLGARRVPTGEYPVVFDPQTAASLLRHLAGAIAGPALYRRASFLLGRLGEPIASPHVTVEDDPLRPAAPGSRPFDAEGVASRRLVVVEAGVLQSYLLDAYSARRLGLRPTGHAARSFGDAPGAAPTNFFLAPGPHPPEAIIGSIEAGLYVTELIGFGVNGVTGDYSRGAAGLWIERGELAYPVEEITIAGTLPAMFRGIEMV